MATTFDNRINRARQMLADKGWAGLLIGPGPELAYFTGRDIFSHERLTCLVITAEETHLIAPSTDEPGGWCDGEDAHRLAVDKLPKGDVGLGSGFTTAHVLRFQELIDGSTHLLPEEIMSVKERGEIGELARAGAAIDRVHAQVPELLQAGVTEEEVAKRLDELILREHAEVDFVIVGSGPNGANPHHSHSERVLQPGDPVVVDIGGTLDSGYHSDSTRTYVVPGGEPPADFLKAFDAVAEGFRAACNLVRPGVTAGQLDEAARSVIEKAGFGEYFTHRLGHGIGLAGHERPWIVGNNDTVIEENMTFSIEPGVYVPGKWGIRIEDIVVVRGSGAETFNHRPHEL